MNSVITIKGRHKLLKARAEGVVVPKIIGVAFGNGGVNSRGEVIEPLESQTALNNEIHRKEVLRYEYLDDLTCEYICYLEADEIPNENINELALYDSDDDLVAIKNFTTKSKGADLEMEFRITDNFKAEVM